MNIKGTRVTHETVHVEVDPREILKTMKLKLFNLYGIPSDAYLTHQNQLVCDERNWRHGSVGTDMLNPNPTQQIIDVMKAYKAFADHFNAGLDNEEMQKAIA